MQENRQRYEKTFSNIILLGSIKLSWQRKRKSDTINSKEKKTHSI